MSPPYKSSPQKTAHHVVAGGVFFRLFFWSFICHGLELERFSEERILKNIPAKCGISDSNQVVSRSRINLEESQQLFEFEWEFQFQAWLEPTPQSWNMVHWSESWRLPHRLATGLWQISPPDMHDPVSHCSLKYTSLICFDLPQIMYIHCSTQEALVLYTLSWVVAVKDKCNDFSDPIQTIGKAVARNW